jgi:hypothetical protein
VGRNYFCRGNTVDSACNTRAVGDGTLIFGKTEIETTDSNGYTRMKN